MFDISYSPWLILALVGLIFFRPDDWQELAFHSGRWVRRVRAYVLEWQEYLEFTADDIRYKKNDNTVVVFLDSVNVYPITDTMLWQSKQMGSRIISVPPHV